MVARKPLSNHKTKSKRKKNWRKISNEYSFYITIWWYFHNPLTLTLITHRDNFSSFQFSADEFLYSESVGTRACITNPHTHKTKETRKIICRCYYINSLSLCRNILLNQRKNFHFETLICASFRFLPIIAIHSPWNQNHEKKKIKSLFIRRMLVTKPSPSSFESFIMNKRNEFLRFNFHVKFICRKSKSDISIWLIIVPRWGVHRISFALSFSPSLSFIHVLYLLIIIYYRLMQCTVFSLAGIVNVQSI